MAFFEHLEEFACRRVVFVRGQDVHIGFRTGASDEGMDIVVSGFRVGEGRTIVFRTVVATDAIFLDDAVVEIKFKGNGTRGAEVILDFARLAARRHRQNGLRGVELRFVAAVAAGVFAGHADKPASEELDRRAVLVDRLD